MPVFSQLTTQMRHWWDEPWWNQSLNIIQQYYWVPLLVIGILVIVVLYLLFRPLNRIKVTKNLEPVVQTTVREQQSDTIKKIESPENNVRVTTQESPIEVALRLLESDERNVVEILVKEGGSMLQKEISWKTGYSRVKTHRVLVRLIRRGVVTSDKYYNTNRITLSNWLLEKRDNSPAS
jgi:hypothetical protein